MMNNLHVWHQQKSANPLFLMSGKGVWQTCLRTIKISFEPSALNLMDGFDAYKSEQAYRFLLEVVSGLHSPVLGETEVLGQFKIFANDLIESDWQFAQLFQNLMADTKKLRQRHLVNTGSHSYGSVVRKLAGKRVAVLGAGQMCQELIPWLLKENSSVQILCRNPERAKQNFSDDLSLKFHKLENETDLTNLSIDTLIVAAPIENDALGEMDRNLELMIDLREDSQSRDYKTKCNRSVSLSELFAMVSDQDHERQKTRALAKEFAKSLAKVRAERAMVRPFGWEDLCG